MTEIFWVEDFLSGEVIDDKYYSTREEAAARRNEMWYGIVKSFELQDGEMIPKRDGKRRAIEILRDVHLYDL